MNLIYSILQPWQKSVKLFNEEMHCAYLSHSTVGCPLVSTQRMSWIGQYLDERLPKKQGFTESGCSGVFTANSVMTRMFQHNIVGAQSFCKYVF